MNTKETFIKYLQKAGFDTFTACEIANKIMKEIKNRLYNARIGTTVKYVFQNKIFTVKKTKPINKLDLE